MSPGAGETGKKKDPGQEGKRMFSRTSRPKKGKKKNPKEKGGGKRALSRGKKKIEKKKNRFICVDWTGKIGARGKEVTCGEK